MVFVMCCASTICLLCKSAMMIMIAAHHHQCCGCDSWNSLRMCAMFLNPVFRLDNWAQLNRHIFHPINNKNNSFVASATSFVFCYDFFLLFFWLFSVIIFSLNNLLIVFSIIFSTTFFSIKKCLCDRRVERWFKFYNNHN